MKMGVIICGILLCISGLYAITSSSESEEGQIKEHPTKKEWLEVYMTHKIKQWTDLWEHRIAMTAGIYSEEREIVITLASANGQEKISQSGKNTYVHDVETIVKVILEEYVWAKNFKLTIQYI